MRIFAGLIIGLALGIAGTAGSQDAPSPLREFGQYLNEPTGMALLLARCDRWRREHREPPT